MKKSVVFLCLFFTVIMLHAKAIHEDFKNADEKTRLGYAFGMIIGSRFGLDQMGIEFDYGAITEGLKAIAEGDQTPFSIQEAMEIVQAAVYDAKERQNSRIRQIEDEYLAANGRRQEVRTTESGLQYEIIKKTEGEKPNINSIVKVNYTGTFTDGSPFDSSTQEVPLETVIPGWAEGLMLMSPGSIYRLYIPSSLAFGEEGIQGVIPPYSTLIFTVELLEIIDEFEEED
jgi:FKBP-type peptidyl-prolyl cis-trans isomerase